MDLIPIKKFIAVNRLKEVTNPIIFEKGNIPTTDGLLSTEIFGINATERKSNFAYIDLKTQLIHPVIYKSLLRMNRNIEYIIQGSKNFVITEKGELVEDEEKGSTGATWLYNNWEKIKFPRNDSRIRNERIDLLEAFDKDTIFVHFWIVIPAFYRDVNLQDTGEGKVAVHELTKMYSQLIRYASIVEKSNGFEFMINTTKYNMQLQLVEIYDYYKARIEKKHGLIKKSLMGKSVDYGVRTVISAPRIGYNRPEDMMVDSTHTGIPLYMCCSLLTPFIIHWVRGFFRREFESTGSKYPIKLKDGTMTYAKLKNPELHFNEEYIEKAIAKFIKSPYSRFDKIMLPLDGEFEGKHAYLNFRGREYAEGEPESESPLVQREATWTDVLYMAAYECCKDKFVYITRYPLSNITSGIFVTRISVLSTVKTMPMYVGNTVYKNYPCVDLSLDESLVPSQFTDTTNMCNLYLAAIGGDYDGDQVTLKIPFTQEANKEAELKMKEKTQILNSYGRNQRSTTNELLQTLFMLTKDE